MLYGLDLQKGLYRENPKQFSIVIDSEALSSLYIIYIYFSNFIKILTPNAYENVCFLSRPTLSEVSSYMK